MQSVILAAGKGSRLHPITTNRSKAMLPILGKPIVERVMEDLAGSGINDFILVISPDAPHITQYFHRESQLDVQVRFVYQIERLGMADALRCAAPLIREDFVLSACDNLVARRHIIRMLDRWRGTSPPNAILTLMQIPKEQARSSGVVALDGAWVQQIVEKPDPEDAPSDIGSLPLYCLPYSILEYLPEISLSPRGEYELQDAIQMLIDRRGRVLGLEVEERLTLTRPADLLEINRIYLTAGNDRPQLQPQTVGPNTHLITPLRIEAGTVIGANCTIGPNVYIERDCQIGDHTTIQDTVVLREAVVSAGAEIRDQVVS